MYLQHWHGWCHVKLLRSRRVLCTPYNHAPCHFTQSHIRKVHACLAATWHLHFWRNDWDLFRATAATEIRVSTESWPRRRKLFRRSCRDSNPWPFNHESGALTTELSPLRRFVRRSLRICSRKVMEAAYKAVLKPLLEYASPVWYSSCSDSIEKAQRSASRVPGHAELQADIKRDCHAWRAAGLAIAAVKKEKGLTHNAVHIEECSAKYWFEACPNIREPEEKSPPDQLLFLSLPKDPVPATDPSPHRPWVEQCPAALCLWFACNIHSRVVEELGLCQSGSSPRKRFASWIGLCSLRLEKNIAGIFLHLQFTARNKFLISFDLILFYFIKLLFTFILYNLFPHSTPLLWTCTSKFYMKTLITYREKEQYSLIIYYFWGFMYTFL